MFHETIENKLLGKIETKPYTFKTLKADLEKCKADLLKCPEDNIYKLQLQVKGDVLTMIESKEDLEELFAFITDRMDVVMACRVSPK